ncbi:1923_t:CDS:2, partial [Gigaspora rosea]
STSNNGLVFADQVQIPMKVLYQLQRDRPGFIKLSPVRFQLMIENANAHLHKFFNQMVGLYLSASGISSAAIDTLHNLDVMNNILLVYYLDDYHNIYKKRCPNATTLSTASHLAIFICKPVKLCAPIPLIFNNWNLDISYGTQRLQWIVSGDLKFDFNKIDLLTVHVYDNAINE